MISAGAGELFQLMRDGRPRTRAELVEETGLARTSVVNRLAALAAVGLVTPTGTAAASGGRPAARLVFEQTSRVCIGIDLGATHGSVGILDLAGEVLHEESRTLDIAEGPIQILTWALDTAERLLAAAGRQRHLLGVGVGVPGPVEHSTGRPIRPPIMPGWDGFDIPAFIRQRLDAPVLVDNDVNLLALGERATRWPGVSDLLFIKVATGIGAGIILGGQLQRGARGSAGDIGHVQVPGVADDRDLEALASTPAIAASLSRDGASVDTTDVIERIRTGDPMAVTAARDAGRIIGKVTAACVSILNPSVVVIGGQLGVNVQEIIAGVREVVYQTSIPLATQHLNIVPAEGGTTAGIRGAGLMVLNERLSATAVDELIADI
ncbi:ROK family protein [Microbacterium sp. NPDC078428]|uniref:ROK family protein n=1 Tax=Microbacterium limosum TaxID=3079935 RepID=A0AAU0MHA9_9MICO|nr:ROK family protein [Microbacterium sp. Y20]WOQ69402.1 ROK family protein [Microbacterium sp. Y20]